MVRVSYSSCCWCFCQPTMPWLNTQQRRDAFCRTPTRANGVMLFEEHQQGQELRETNHSYSTAFIFLIGLKDSAERMEALSLRSCPMSPACPLICTQAARRKWISEETPDGIFFLRNTCNGKKTTKFNYYPDQQKN